MKRVTETDIRALRPRAGRAQRPKSKVGIDGTVQLTGNEFTITKESLDILTYAGQCKDAMTPFCEQADRSARYYKGEQWGDPVEIPDRCGCVKTVTEEEYIKSQGRPALKHNLIRPIVRNVIGQFRDSPYKSIVYSSDEGGQGAADQMSVKLNDVLRYNDSVERDAREYESFLVTGPALYITGYAYDPSLGMPMPFFRALDYHRYFQNPDAVDVAGKDVHFCGDFVDVPVDEAKSLYAHNKAQEKAIEDIYTNGDYVLPVMYNAYVMANPAAKTFLASPFDENCRIIRVCRMEGFWDLTVHDYADASFETYSTREFPDKEREVEEEIARRKKMARDLGIDYDDPASQLKVVYEKKYVRFTDEQIAAVVKIYQDWQMGGPQSSAAEYAQPELYRAVHKDEIAANNWSLVPSRYIEFVDRDTELDYKEALKTAGAAASDLLKRQDENAKRLAAAFKALGVKL